MIPLEHKKYWYIFVLIAPLFSNIMRAMDPKTIEENRQRAAWRARRNAHLPSIPLDTISAPCVPRLSVPYHSLATQTVAAQRNQADIKIARAQAAARYKVLTKNEGLAERLAELSGTQQGIDFNKIPFHARSPWRRVMEFCGESVICPRLFPSMLKPTPLIPGRYSHHSSDGTCIATYKHDTVYISDTNTEKCVYELRGHTKPVSHVLFSPDNTFLVTAGNDGTACIWDTKTGKKGKVLEGHTKEIERVSISNDSKLIATISKLDFRQGLRVWNARTGICIFSPNTERVRYLEATFSPCGNFLIAKRDWGLWGLDVWNLLSGQQSYSSSIVNASFGQNGNLVAVRGFGYPIEVGTKEGEIVGKFNGDASDFTLSPGGTYGISFMGGDLPPNPQIWDIRSSSRLNFLDEPESAIVYIKFSPDEKYILVSRLTNAPSGKICKEIQLWDMTTRKKIHKQLYDAIISNISIDDSRHYAEFIAHNKIVRTQQDTQILSPQGALENLTPEQSHFIIVCEAVTAERKMPLWVIARKTGLDKALLKAVFDTFSDFMKNIMQKTYGLSDVHFGLQVPLPASPPPAVPVSVASSHSSNSSSSSKPEIPQAQKTSNQSGCILQ